MKKNNKDKELKFVDETRFEVNRIVGDITGVDGKIYRKAAKMIQTEPLELGSIMNPKNTDVIGIKYNVPSKQKREGFIDFSGLFK